MLCFPSMHLDRRCLAAFCCAAVCAAAPAKAQPIPPPPPPAAAPPAPATAPAPPAAPDTLETPYGDAQAPALPPGPAAPVPVEPPPPAALPAAPSASAPAAVRADKRPLGPIRAQRKLALLGEIGWNGLAGFGPILSYNLTPHVAFDLGGGLSFFGWKAGLRTRYNFLTSNFTPFVGFGVNATSGLGEVTSNPADDPNGDPNRDPVTINVKPSYLLQTTVGFDLVHKHGFTMLGCIGYAVLLNHDNFDVLAGSLTSDEKQAVDVLFKSGVVISLAMGYSFE